VVSALRQRPDQILRLTAPLKGLANRFAYVVLLAAAFGILLLGKADPQIYERVRMAVTDVSAPLLDALSRPAVTVADMIDEVQEMGRLREEISQLKTENARLMQWQSTARKLLAENKQLHALLGFVPEKDARTITARVIGDSGGAFVRSLLVNAGRRQGVRKGQVAVVGIGVLGRVAEVGERSARILLINDLNSRVPVVIETSRERAVMGGDNSAMPKLNYLPVSAKVRLGDRVVTSGHGGVFPPGLAVGSVASLGPDDVRVTPFADATKVEYVRLMDFGFEGVIDDLDSGKKRPKRDRRNGSTARRK
jgi:rod shape-determining protein MreC